MRLSTLPKPAPPPARAAAMTAKEHRLAAGCLKLQSGSDTGLTDRQLAECLAGLDACYHGLGHGEPTDRDDTLSRARKLYREALKRAVAPGGDGATVAIGDVRLAIDRHGDLEIRPVKGKTRGRFVMTEVA